MELAAYLLIGAIIGILSGFFGVGGGFVLTPVLLLFGFAPVTAIATSLLYTIGTSVSGVVAHLRLRNIEWKLAFITGLSGLAATRVAHPFVLFLESRGLSETVIPGFYLLLLGYFAFSMLHKKKGKPKEPAENGKHSLPIILFIGFFGGFASTALGVGGGFIIVPLFISLLALQPRLAVGTSLVSVFFIVISGFISYAFTTPINYVIGIMLVIGALIGGQVGAHLTAYFSDPEIKKRLGLLYIVTWLSVLLKLFGLNMTGLAGLTAFIIYLIYSFSRTMIGSRKEQQNE
ncbi:sulfite exporter TauE/SafE family protein [Bacillus marinisedimentorum]|uniref:sulfite exporter TauE/SafE family protein n=1 Tax=Bacillus marinisedimentorum TaxID=1821260 RepID=UPI00087282D8|nr:sulfite exporter TauE/SafE family protein [Bacillus marinisedimentorum]